MFIRKMRILIIKTSAIGDILQSFCVIDYLLNKYPDVQIDFVVENRFENICKSHPHINKSISFDIKSWKKNLFKISTFKSFFAFLKNLRLFKYDLAIDLQGNCKSALVTCFAKANVKLGYSLKCVREWPNIFSTNKRYFVDGSIHVHDQYLNLVKLYFKDSINSLSNNSTLPKTLLNISTLEEKKIEKILSSVILKNEKEIIKVLVSPFSKWKNKQLDFKIFLEFLEKIQIKNPNIFFFLIWGDLSEFQICRKINEKYKSNSMILKKMTLPTLQNLLSKMDLVFCMDSAILHLTALLGNVPTFSFFGPTNPSVYKPKSNIHGHFFKKCPENIEFVKVCPYLRSCREASCVNNVDLDALLKSFENWKNYSQRLSILMK
jgi:heptosyltransferase I